MQCRQCGFENMPGLERCGRCSSVLTVRGSVVVSPPRAKGPRWLRRTGYRARALLRLDLLQRSPAPAAVPARAPKSAPARPPQPPLWPGLVSLVPGLGHLLTHRLPRVKWWWIGWCGCLLLGLFLYGGSLGGLLLGTAMGLHAWIICDAAQVDRRMDSALARVAASILVFVVVVYCLYAPVRRAAGHYVRAVGCAVDMEADGIRQGDTLLVSCEAYQAAVPRRGDIVVYTVAALSTPELHGYPFQVQGGEVVSKVIALPGDAVAFSGARITVSMPGGGAVEHVTPQMPVAAGSFDVTVPDGTYLCLPPEFSRTGHGGTPPSLGEYVRIVAMPSGSAIHGRAFMVWNPLWRRWWIARPSVEEAE